jgi:hypothetical protein
MKKPVKLYVRVENQKEICIGSARQMKDVPALFEQIARIFRDGMAPDRLESPPSSVSSHCGSHCG